MPRLLPKVGTLGGMAADRLDVHLFCLDCRRSVMIDARVLVWEHGGGLSVQRFLERLTCSKCGARYPRVELRATPRTAPFTEAWTAERGE